MTLQQIITGLIALVTSLSAQLANLSSQIPSKTQLAQVAAPTEVIGLVRETCSEYSNCYTSLSAWEAAYGGIDFGSCTIGDLVCANAIATARIDGSWNSPDALAVNINGWDTGPNNYINIYTTSSARHTGVWSDAKYRNTSGISIIEQYVRIDGLQIHRAYSGTGSVYGINFSRDIPDNAEFRISNNIIKATLSGTGRGFGILTEYKGGDTANRVIYAYNNLIYDFINDTTLSGSFRSYTGFQFYSYNNTVYNSYYGFKVDNGKHTAKNNIAYNCTDGFNGTFVAGSNYNASSLVSDAPGANSIELTSDPFLDSANDNLHLNASSQPINTGINDPGSGLFSNDIDGDTRSTWDIGADESNGSVAPPPPPPPPPPDTTSSPDTTPPTVSFSSPSPDSTVSSTLSITASASDNVSVSGVQFKLDGSNLGAEDTSSPYSYSLDTTAVSNGSHTITATARDSAGNTANSSVNITINNITIDPTPTIQVESSPSGPATVILNGRAYNLKDHPRVWLDGPGGNLTLSLIGPNKPKTAAGWAPYDNLKLRADSFANGSYYPGKQASSGAADGNNCALMWLASGKPTNPSDVGYKYLQCAIAEVKLGLDMVSGSTGCDESAVYCNGRDDNLDYSRMNVRTLAQTYSIVREQMTPAERSAFADAMLNDNDSAHGGLGMAGDPNQSCRATNGENTWALGTGTITLNGNTVTGLGTRFLSELAPGDLMNARNSYADNLWVKQVISDTQLIVEDTVTHTINQVAFKIGKKWQPGFCGWVWFSKHHQASISSTCGGSGAACKANYPPTGGSTIFDPRGNLYLTQASGYIALGLALADDDSRARTLLQQAWDYYYKEMYGYEKSTWTGWGQSDGQYWTSRTGWMATLIAIMTKNSIIGAPDLTSGDYLKNILLYFPYNTVAPASNKFCMPWGDGGACRVAPRQLIGLYYLLYLYNGSQEAARANDWLQATYGVDWKTSLVGLANSFYLPSAFVFVDPAFARNDFRAAPLQHFFEETDASSCPSGINNCRTDGQSFHFAISRTGWTSATDTNILFYVADNDGADHMMLGVPGGFYLHKNGKPLVGGDGTEGYSQGGPKQSTIYLGPYGWVSPSYATQRINVDRWAGQSQTGPVDNSYSYLRARLHDPSEGTVYAGSSNGRIAAAPDSINRVDRNFLHFKKPANDDYLIIYDDISTPAGGVKTGYFHLNLNGCNPGSCVNFSGSDNGGSATITHSNAKLSMRVLSVGANPSRVFTDNPNGSYSGGLGTTFRISVCPAGTNGTCDNSATSGEWLTILKPSSDITDAIGNVSSLSNAEWAGAQIDDSSSSKVALFARGGATKTSVAFTTTHSNTAQYLIAGLSPGTYTIRKGTADILTNQSVNSRDNTLYFENSSGSYQVFQTGATPPPETLALPSISNLVGSDTTQKSTQISWETNVATNGQIFYGTTPSYGLSSSLVDNTTKTKSHSIILSNLSPATTYHFKVTSIDANNQSISSPDFFFTTLSASSNNTNIGSNAGNTGTGSGSSYSNTVVYIPPATTSSTAIITPTPQVSGLLTRNLLPASKNEEVKILQSFLVAQGYLTADSVTGFYGPLTQKAVQNFQKSQGIISTGNFWTTGYGMVGPITRDRINSLMSLSTPTYPAVTAANLLNRNLSRGSEGEDVKTLQQFLVSQNLTTADNVTGYFGPLTEAAIKKFQVSQNIVSSGTPQTTGYGNVGPLTRAKINAMLNATSSGVQIQSMGSLQSQIDEIQKQVLELLLKLQKTQ